LGTNQDDDNVSIHPWVNPILEIIKFTRETKFTTCYDYFVIASIDQTPYECIDFFKLVKSCAQ
jgi:hypothetical protein